MSRHEPTTSTPQIADVAPYDESSLGSPVPAGRDTGDDGTDPVTHTSEGLSCDEEVETHPAFGPASALRAAARWALPAIAAVTLYAGFLLLQGTAPLAVLWAMVVSALGSPNAIGETLVRMAPLLLAALATAVPARAGLFNIGGEGQLVAGALGAMMASHVLGGSLSTVPTLLLLVLGGAVGGAMWGAIPGLLKVATNTNEAITTLLLNYLAVLLLTWLVYAPLRDPQGLGQAYSVQVTEHLPIMWGSRVHVGILIALFVAGATYIVLRRTAWGFQLRVVGGNPEAARRAGLRVGELQLTAMVVGGALAGLGGAIELVGIESRLRPGMMVGWGFIGFLASWMARHHALKVIPAALVLAFIAVGGSGLRMTSGLSGSAVNILMAVLLLAILGWAPRRTARR